MPRLPKNVYKRGDRFYLRCKVNGRDVRKSLGSNLQEAKRRAALLIPSLRCPSTEADVPKVTEVTVAEFAHRWLEERVNWRRNEQGRLLAAQRVRDHIAPMLGGVPLCGLTLMQIGQVRAAAESGGLAPQSVWHILADVRCMLRYAVDVGALCASPFRASVMPKLPERLPKGLTDDEVDRILAATPVKYELAVKLGLLTGLRWGELRRLQWRNVKDLPEPHIELELTKSGKVRRVPLVPEAVVLLRHERERTIWSFVLPFRANKPCSFVDRIGKQAGLKWNFHRLRHTFACRWLDQGGSIEMLCRMLGHSTVAVTERYGQISDRALFAEVKRISAR